MKSILKKVSVGKYNHGLYFRKKLQYSSVPGGIITIILFLLAASYSLWMIIDCIVNPDYKTDTCIESLDEYEEFFTKINIGNFHSPFKQITFSFDNSTARLNCADFNL